MFQPISFFIGLRYSRSRSRSGFVSFITFFSVAGILLGVASLITVVSVMNGFEGELKKRVLGLVPHVIVNSQEPYENWQSTRESLLAHPFIKQVTPLIESESLIQSTTDLQAVLMQGIDPEFEQQNIVHENMQLGSVESLTSGSYAVVMGRSLARKLDVVLGDNVRLVLPNVTLFTPLGRVPMQRTFVVAGIFNVGSQIDDSLVYIHRADAAKMLRQQDDEFHELRLYLYDAFDAEFVVSELSKQFPTLDFITWKESQGALFSAVNMEKNMMWLMLGLIVAVAAFNIVSALVMVVIDKQGEIGILQTLGMSTSGIMKIFITQGMVNGGWGVIFGSILGIVLTLNLNDLMAMLGVSVLGQGYATQALPIALLPSDVITIIFSALAMSFIATLYPAYRASQTLPAEVLRNE